MNRRNFMKSWVVTGAAIVGVQAGIGAAAPAKPSLVPVAYDSYCVDSPLRDRGYAAPDLGEIDLNNPLESIA